MILIHFWIIQRWHFNRRCCTALNKCGVWSHFCCYLQPNYSITFSNIITCFYLNGGKIRLQISFPHCTLDDKVIVWMKWWWWCPSEICSLILSTLSFLQHKCHRKYGHIHRDIDIIFNGEMTKFDSKNGQRRKGNGQEKQKYVITNICRRRSLFLNEICSSQQWKSYSLIQLLL
jgi:hypothetical protein